MAKKTAGWPLPDILEPNPRPEHVFNTFYRHSTNKFRFVPENPKDAVPNSPPDMIHIFESCHVKLVAQPPEAHEPEWSFAGQDRIQMNADTGTRYRFARQGIPHESPNLNAGYDQLVFIAELLRKNIYNIDSFSMDVAVATNHKLNGVSTFVIVQAVDPDIKNPGDDPD
ncbi:MAG TPA: hypothetical protein VMH86_11850 [Rhizomicrobium sp.]|nr:hypothetical protein [Rhizomicrobium sp.]